MTKVRVKIDRKFLPHKLLLNAASYHLEDAKKNEKGYYYDWLGVILLSALAIEAIGNTYGEVLISNWDDFETARPKAKLRLVANKCGIEPNFKEHPWSTACQLIAFRNSIAHAKPEQIVVEKDYAANAYQKAVHSMPESKFEKMITEGFAIQGHNAIEKIIEILNAAIDQTYLADVDMEGWSSQATAIT